MPTPLLNLPRQASPDVPHVVIIGAGFAGIEAAKSLKNDRVRVTLVDKQNHHLFQPLLYQVATAALAAPDIATPVRKIFRHQENVTVLLDEAVGVDLDDKVVHLKESGGVAYDQLLLAAGSKHTYFGHDEWAAHAPGLKTLADAFDVRRRILHAFEAAEREADPVLRQAWLNFVVVGGGPTGVEMAGAIAEIATRTLVADFRNFDPKDAKVHLVEAGPRVLTAYAESLSEQGRKQLESLGVDVHTGGAVEHVDANGVVVNGSFIPAKTVVWGAGVEGSAVGGMVVEQEALHRSKRVPVRPTLQLPQHDDVFIAGDLAYLETDGVAVPALAPAAIQQGRHVAANLRRLWRQEELKPFRYLNKGSLATIGRRRAVGALPLPGGRELKLSGVIAWAGWLFIHLMYLVGFRNRLAVLFDWAWAYLTFQRSARVVLAEPASSHSDGHVDDEDASTPSTAAATRAPRSRGAKPKPSRKSPTQGRHRQKGSARRR